MGKMCQLVMGPAGSGKSTFCKTIVTHCQAIKRSVHLINLDPAAENFEYTPTIDIKDLITLDDVMEELEYGPNGALIYCMEYLVENLDWLEEKLDDYVDDYLIIDCPGQIELYTHFPIIRQITDLLTRLSYRTCGVYVLDAQFTQDHSKFVSGALSAMSAMIQLEIPHINIFSKVDLLEGDGTNTSAALSKNLDKYLDMDLDSLSLGSTTAGKFKLLNMAIVDLLQQFEIVRFLKFNIRNEDSIAYVLAQIDNAIQFGEDEEPKDIDDEGMEYDDDGSAELMEYLQ
ncbi:GPN-loop GTPase 3 [Nowakowskiella sp. JEL0407]|nr:GPN-loop GTPase 3 [Nowakowskiella sp. JEL0407]